MTFSTKVRSPVAINSVSFMKIKTLQNAQKAKKFTFYHGVAVVRSGVVICHDFISGRGRNYTFSENSVTEKLLFFKNSIFCGVLISFRRIQRDNKFSQFTRPLNSKFFKFHSLKNSLINYCFPIKKTSNRCALKTLDAQTIETC